jgi:hypothetical protein
LGIGGIVCGLAMPASAQTASRERPVEIGVGLSGLVTPQDFEAANFGRPAVSTRLGVAVTPRFSIEAEVDVGHRNEPALDQKRTEVIYSFGLTQRLQRLARGGFQPYLSYRLAGYIARVRRSALTVTREGMVVDIPPSSHTVSDPPVATLFGFGISRTLGPHVKARIEAGVLTVTVIPRALRLVGGLSVSLAR